MKSLSVRPEIHEILLNVNIWFDSLMKSYECDWNFTKNTNNILNNFWDSSKKYKSDFIKIFLNKRVGFKEYHKLQLPNKKIKKIAINIYIDILIPWYMKSYHLDMKQWDYISDKNSFNLLYIIYKKSRSFNKYWIRKYIFKEYLERDNIPEDKLLLFKNIILEFYLKEYDLSKHILWSENFIYSHYSKREINILYKMWLVIKDYDDTINIFKWLSWFNFWEVIKLKYKNNIKIKEWNIISSYLIYDCFYYFYENTDSFQKYWIREEQLIDFLGKEKIWLKSALKYIKILVSYINSLDEIFSTPYIDLLDKLKEFNYKYYDLRDFKNTEEYVDALDWFYDKEDLSIDNIEKEYKENNHEILFLWIFYDIEKINWYTYYDAFNYYDSEYEKSNEDAIGDNMSYHDYNTLLK